MNPFHNPQIARRNRKAARFKYLAASALVFSMTFLIIFIFDMIIKGAPAFTQAYVRVDITITEEVLSNPNVALSRDDARLISRSWIRTLPELIKSNPSWMGTTQSFWALAHTDVDQYLKGHSKKLKESEIKYLEKLQIEKRVDRKFNSILFFTGDSKIPENAGFFSAVVGSVMTMLVTMLVSVPIGVATAVYLQEFAKDTRFTQIVEININNLAAVPSILFGLLGLAIFIIFFGVPRSSPLVGGLTLALMSLPVIIVSSKAALKSVPDSIRQAGFGLGLTKWQVTRDHVVPLAGPGMLTGSIIALAQALGETAPLIIVGMIAFVPDAPSTIFEAATVMPAQIYTWSGMPEVGYVEKTAAGILILLAVMMIMNGVAIWLRKKYTRTW